jgi:hypothetical protein
MMVRYEELPSSIKEALTERTRGKELRISSYCEVWGEPKQVTIDFEYACDDPNDYWTDDLCISFPYHEDVENTRLVG